MKNRRRKLRGGATLSQIQTANKNLETIKRLSMPKPPLQPPGKFLHFPITQRGYGKIKRQRGGAYYDQYGSPIHAF